MLFTDNNHRQFPNYMYADILENKKYLYRNGDFYFTGYG
jgi:hypothetical protein